MYVGARAGIYCRISQDRGTGEARSLGVARQEADCRALIKRRKWSVADVFIDNDASAFGHGRRAKRPEYERLLAALRDGQIDAVVMWHPDRLHRSPIELEGFIALVES